MSHADGEIRASFGACGGRFALLVHGGAGDPSALPGPHGPSGRAEGCLAAAREGARILASGGSALDAAQRAVEVLEDDPRFNAGTGACLNARGEIELDASVMEGTLLRVGAVAALPPFAHPIAIARRVLEHGRHVLYAGPGAAEFAREHGFEPADPAAMVTAHARAALARARAAAAGGSSGGTVGAVARDVRGGVAAATSTGGRVNKAPGRVGDSPIPGAGTYADDDAGACSNTGDGEAVLRLCLAKTACDWLRGGVPPEEAARAALRLLSRRGRGLGGMILVDREGRLGWARTTGAMAWAAVGESLNLEAGT